MTGAALGAEADALVTSTAALLLSLLSTDRSCAASVV